MIRNMLDAIIAVKIFKNINHGLELFESYGQGAYTL